MWEAWGAPPGITRVLRQFYSDHYRWVEYRGRVATEPITPKRSLLQGCPASPLLLTGIMAVWAEHLRRKVPRVSFGIHLDDRTIWAEGRDAAEHLRAALEAGRELDGQFGLREHEGKRDMFANKAAAVRALQSLAAEVPNGRARTTFKLLGIH